MSSLPFAFMKIEEKEGYRCLKVLVDALAIIDVDVIQEGVVPPLCNGIRVAKATVVHQGAPRNIGLQVHVPITDPCGLQRKTQPLLALAS